MQFAHNGYYKGSNPLGLKLQRPASLSKQGDILNLTLLCFDKGVA